MTTFLSRLDNLQYDFTVRTDSDKKVYPILDILTKITTRIDDDDISEWTEKYYITLDETPEIIAYKYYGNIHLHWVILYVNKIYDLGEQWPLQDKTVYDLAVTKYGENNINDIHHYEYNGVTMDQTFINDTYGAENAYPITNLEYEESLNEAKRNIVLIKPKFIDEFIEMFNNELVS